MQSERTLRCHFSPTGLAQQHICRQSCGKQALTYIANGNANGYKPVKGKLGNIYANYLSIYILTQASDF